MIEKLAMKITNWIGSVNSVIIHTIIFVVMILLWIFAPIIPLDRGYILLILTTLVSLEAIYLSIFIQMSVNYQSQKLHNIQEHVEDIQENVEELNEDDEDDDDDEDIKKIKETLDLLVKEIKGLKRKNK